MIRYLKYSLPTMPIGDAHTSESLQIKSISTVALRIPDGDDKELLVHRTSL